ncbi:hypothetical protein L227DRAFT_574875 [Lentinus tigrinus ALCF2SS1-6]|uniref:Uncharacterized protein n=1 Tax=Lentinus tigrinus ALCF2SS1-6 TaxID=1328759 RepID=A0A5C2SAD1_9APHY|nr:hypothetical protein L227DRAFT_574875 [Lentinus tigrinus ALCF2SS1-6]
MSVDDMAGQSSWMESQPPWPVDNKGHGGRRTVWTSSANAAWQLTGISRVAYLH